MPLNKISLLIVVLLAFVFKTAVAQVSGNKTPRTIVVLGSSTSFGYGATPIDSSYVNKLRINLRTYKRQDTIIDLAVPGYTTYEIQPTGSIPSPDTGTIAKPDPASNITYALTKKPNLVIINMPTNDIYDNYTDAQIINNYKVVVKLLESAQVPYIITSTQPRDFSAAQRARLRPFTNLTKTTFGANNVIDYLDQLSNPDYTIRDTLEYGDGIHVNNKGHKIIYNAFINFQPYRQIVCYQQSVTFNKFGEIFYGKADFSPGGVATSGLPVSYTSSNAAVATIINGQIHITGPGTTNITATQAGNIQYLAAPDFTEVLTVKPATVTITAPDTSKQYGSENPALKLKYSGFVNGDDTTKLTSKPVIAIKAAANSPVGVYAITVSGAALSNYNFTYVSGKLTVKPDTLTVKADDKSKTFGDANPALTATYSGFISGENTSKLSVLPVISTTATASSAVGTYPITAGGASATNYVFKYLPGTLTVNAIPAPVIASFSPSSAITGTIVTITGNNFSNATGVGFGGTPATSFTVVSPTTITAVVGDGASGAVSVVTPGGTATTSGFNFVFTIPQDNFIISTTSATCKGSANGIIDITAIHAMDYKATITGNGLNKTSTFSSQAEFASLAAGNYSVCITVLGQSDFKQCYDLVITEPKDLSVYATVAPANSVNLQLDGAAQYHVSLNGVLYTTKNNSITLPLTNNSNELIVTTDAICQGVFQKVINITNNNTPYPNPFQSTLNVNIGSQNIDRLNIEVHSLSDGKLVFTKQYTAQSGVVQLDLSGLKTGMYALHVSSKQLEKVFKVLKQ